MLEVTTLGWAATLALLGALVAFDLSHSRGRPHAVGLREALAWSLF
jgi:tellurite resistance protein TerC